MDDSGSALRSVQPPDCEARYQLIIRGTSQATVRNAGDRFPFAGLMIEARVADGRFVIVVKAAIEIAAGI